MVLTVRGIRRRIRWLGAALGEILDEQGVGIFQVVVYLHIGPLAGLYGLLVAGGTPQAVEDSMGPVWNGVWLWLCLGITMCLAGKLIKWDAGMWLQLSGDIAAAFALLVYIVSSIDSAWWGKALYAVFACAALFECVVLLIIRDVRRIFIDQKRRRL